MTALYMLLAAVWNSIRADLFVFGRMVVTACAYPFDFAGDMVDG